MIPFPIGSIVKAGLKLLGRVGDGKATKTGVAAVVTAAATAVAGSWLAPNTINDQNVVEVIAALASVVSAVLGGIGAIVGAFGLGRKAAKAAAESDAS